MNPIDPDYITMLAERFAVALITAGEHKSPRSDGHVMRFAFEFAMEFARERERRMATWFPSRAAPPPPAIQGRRI